MLGRAKQDLTLHIQLVQVGLTTNAERAITVNIEWVEEINRILQRTLGEERGLIMASFVNETLKGGGKIQGRPSNPHTFLLDPRLIMITK